MPISASRRTLMFQLLAYGERDLAQRIRTLTPDEMDRIAWRADSYIATAGESGQALALASVDVLEGASRPLARSRRNMKDGMAAERVRFDPWPVGFWGRTFEDIEESVR